MLHRRLHGTELAIICTAAWPGEPSVKMSWQDIVEWRQAVLAGQADGPWHYQPFVRRTYSEHTGIVRSTYSSTYTGAGSTSHPSCTPGTKKYRNCDVGVEHCWSFCVKDGLTAVRVTFCRSLFSSSFSFFCFPFISCIAFFAIFGGFCYFVSVSTLPPRCLRACKIFCVFPLCAFFSLAFLLFISYIFSSLPSLFRVRFGRRLFILSVSCGYYAVSSVSVATRSAYHMYDIWYVRTLISLVYICLRCTICFSCCVYYISFYFSLLGESSTAELLEPVLWPWTTWWRWVNVRTTTVQVHNRPTNEKERLITQSTHFLDVQISCEKNNLFSLDLCITGDYFTVYTMVPGGCCCSSH